MERGKKPAENCGNKIQLYPIADVIVGRNLSPNRTQLTPPRDSNVDRKKPPKIPLQSRGNSQIQTAPVENLLNQRQPAAHYVQPANVPPQLLSELF